MTRHIHIIVFTKQPVNVTDFQSCMLEEEVGWLFDTIRLVDGGVCLEVPHQNLSTPLFYYAMDVAVERIEETAGIASIRSEAPLRAPFSKKTLVFDEATGVIQGWHYIPVGNPYEFEDIET